MYRIAIIPAVATYFTFSQCIFLKSFPNNNHYPVTFALFFGGLLVAIENEFLDIDESFAAVISIVFAGIITLILRSEAKK